MVWILIYLLLILPFNYSASANAFIKVRIKAFIKELTKAFIEALPNTCDL